MAYRSRERVARVLAHQEADRVPFDTIGFPMYQARQWCDELGLTGDERACFTEGEFKYLNFKIPADRATYAPYLPGLPDEAETVPFGISYVPLKSADGYVAGKKFYYPLGGMSAPEELEQYPFPDVTDSACHAHLDAEVEAARREEYTVVGQMSQTILETSYCMRGLQQLYVDFYENPDFVRALFETLCEIRCFQARRFAEAGVEVLRIGDDIATQVGLIIGPPMYREWIQPFHKRVTDAARAVKPDIQVLYHSDGALTALLPDLIDAGVTAVNPCQPEAMKLPEVKREFGDRMTFWGCTPSQSVYTNDGRAEVKAALESLMRDVAPGGGLVVQFYNMLIMPKVQENLRHFVELFFDLARYR